MSNMLADRIKTADLTKKQQKIADYFIKNQNRLGNLSTLEVAKEIGVSDASVIRFSRAIGFDGYADLKEHVYDMLVENNTNTMSLTERMNVNDAKFPDNDVTEQFKDVMVSNFRNVFAYNHLSDFDKAADMIVKADHKYAIGLRGCKGVATSFGRLLGFMMKNVDVLKDNECTSISSAQDMTTKDVVIMFVFSRFYKIDKHYLDLAKERGTKVILIIDDVTGPLTKYADLTLIAPVESMNFFRSTIGIDVISEYLLTLIGKKIDSRQRIEERDRIIADQRL